MLLDGEVIGDTSGTYTFASPGVYELCAVGNFNCNGRQETCYDIVVNSLEPEERTVVLCPGECYRTEGGEEICAAGRYELPAAADCAPPVFVTLTFDRPDNTRLSAGLCGGDTLNYQEVAYTEAGEYVRTLSNRFGCDSTVVLTVALETCPLEGWLRAEPPACYDGVANATFSIGNGLAPFTYELIGLGTAFRSSGTVGATGEVTTISGLPRGTYLLEVTDAIGSEGFLNANLQPPPPVELQLTTSEFNGWSVSCADAADGTITATASGGVPPYTFRHGGEILTQNQLNGLAAGTYEVVVTDANGCSLTATASIAAPPPLAVTARPVAENCNVFGSGQLADIAVSGGVADYTHGLISGSGGQLADPYDELTAGTYYLQTEDANGCAKSDTFVITRPAPALLEAYATEPIINLGERTDLVAATGIENSITWSGPGAADCANCPAVSVAPTETTTYGVRAVSTDGCSTRDSITVRVVNERKVYLPSGFSPNGDGVNDRLRPFPGRSVAAVHSLEVYDRWGSAVAALDGDEALRGWDGQHRGRAAANGTYVWTVRVEFLDGAAETLRGLVTLVR